MDLDSIYDIKEELGRGTFGIVRRCVDKRTQKVVAIKEIELDLDGEGEESTANEIRVSIILHIYIYSVYLYCVSYL